MGKGDTAGKQWLSDKERFADLFNGTVFQGKQVIKAEEFLSRFRKEDTLYPIITIVFYYGEKEWDGSKDLHSMIDKNLPTELWEMIKAYIPNYHINIIDSNNIGDFERFQTDLQVVLGMLQYRNDKRKLMEYIIENKAYFEHVDVDTYNAIIEFLNSEKVLKNIVDEKEEEAVDMCKALQDLFDEGMEQGVRAMIDTCKEFECSRDTTLQKLVEKIPLSEERASEYMEKYWDK